MGEETRQRALEKWASFTPKIGYPDKWRQWDGLQTSGDSYLANMQAARAFNYRYMLDKIGKQAHGFAAAFGHRSDAEAFQYVSTQIDTWFDRPQYRGSQIVLRLTNTHVASPTWSATWFHADDMWRFTAP